MTLGYPSIRIDGTNLLHHLWSNNGTWWVHYTLHFAGRKRRIRRSLGTRHVDEAIRRRDELLARLARDGEPVPERRPALRRAAVTVAPAGVNPPSRAACAASA